MDTPDIAELYAAEGPFATVYLDSTSVAVPDASARLETRWKSMRRELAGAGATDELLAAIDGALAGDHNGGDTLVLVAGRDGVLARRHLPEPPKRDLGKVGALPFLAPLLEWEQSLLPHVVVTADREGADILAVSDNAEQASTEVHGDTEQIQRSAPGGWSQRRFQQRAENTWEHNAKEVADAVVEVADSVGAKVVLVTGDVRAVQFLQEHLPERIAHVTRVITHDGTPVEAPIDELASDIVREVATAAAEATVSLLRKFREERGQHDRAADGVAPTVEALQRAQVETLLVHADPDDERTAWFGPEPTHLALDRQLLVDLGVDEPREAPLIDVLIRAALGTSAAVHIVPTASAVTEGVGAILRFSDAP